MTQENGQKESKRSEHEEEDREDGGEAKGDREEKMDGSFQRDSTETQCHSPPSHDMEMKTGDRLSSILDQTSFSYQIKTSNPGLDSTL